MGRGFASAGAPPVAHSFGPRSFASHSLSARPNGFHSRFSAHHFHHRHFRNFGYGYFGAIGAPLAVYAPPFSAYGSGFYDDSPAYYPEPVVSAPAPLEPYFETGLKIMLAGLSPAGVHETVGH